MKSVIQKYAKEINNENNITKDDIKTNNKLAILFVNYNANGYLGQPVINDCADVAKHLIDFGYKCFYICNTTSTTAKNVIKRLISQSNKRIVFYYSGHGAQVRDLDGDEDDGYDEAFCFRGGYLIDDDFCNIVNENLKCDKFICISDACHSGTIYDVERVKEDLRNRMICLSACKDYQTSKQLEKNGIFTLQFWNCYDKQTKLLNVSKLNQRLDWFNQELVIYPSNTTLIDF